MALKKLRLLIFFRVSLFCAFLSLSVLVLLSLTALQTEKELQVNAQIFSATKDSATLHEFSQLNTVVPMEVVDREKIDEMLVRYYLSIRYEQYPDPDEMVYRWGRGGPLYLLSLPSVYSDFAQELEKKIEGLPNSVSSIEIKRLERTNNRFDVTFHVYEVLADNQVRFKEKNAILEFGYFSARRRFSPFFTNPYGLVFTRFEEADVKSAKN